MAETATASQVGRRDSNSDPSQRQNTRREQGQWSFLTWSFFLSQIVAAEQAAASAARSGLSEEASSHEGGAEGGDNPSNAAFPPGAMALTAEEASAASPHSAQVAAPPHLNLAVVAPAESAPEAPLIHDTEASGQHQANAALLAAYPGVADGDAAPDLGSAESTILDPIVGPLSDLSGGVVSGVVAPVLDLVVGDVVVPVIGLVGATVDGIVTPTLTFAGDLIGGTVDGIVTPAVDLVGDLIGGTVHAAEPVIDGIVTHAVALAGDLIGGTVQAAEPVIDAVGGSLGSLLGQVSAIAVPAAQQVVAPGSGSLDFEAAAPAASNLINELFEGGRYTEYGLSMQIDPAASPVGSLVDGAVDTADGILTSVTGDTASDETPLPAVHTGGSHLLGDIGLHGLGL